MTDAWKYRMRLVRVHIDYITAEINDIDKQIESLISSVVTVQLPPLHSINFNDCH